MYLLLTILLYHMGTNMSMGTHKFDSKGCVKVTDKKTLQRNQKYQDENLEQIPFKVLKRWGLRDAIARAAKAVGTSSREYILSAVCDRLDHDGQLPDIVKRERNNLDK